MRPGVAEITLCVTAHRTRFLTECLLSVLAQTSTDFDLVLCADTTGEAGVADILERLSGFSRARRVSLLRVDGGTAGAVRNATFRAAVTEWVACLDGDDVLDPTAVEAMLGAARRGDADILAAGSYRIRPDGTPRPMPDSLTYKPPLWLYHADPRTLGHRAHFSRPLTIRRRLWERYPFHEETNREDVDFMLHQLLAGRFVKVPAPLYGYRETAGGFSGRAYVGGDICAVRYAGGYYAELFADRFDPALADNFR